MTIPNFTLRYPRTLIFGPDAVPAVLERIRAAKRPVIFHGQSLLHNPAAAPFLADFPGVEVLRICGMTDEAPVYDVQRWVDAARKHEADLVVAVGGGTVIDAGKLTAAAAPTNCSVKGLFDGTETLCKKGLPFIAVPTTAGTGAECTVNAVLLDPVMQIKRSVRHPDMMPDMAAIDPDLTLSCPLPNTLYSGLDALVQAIESYTSTRGNPISKEHAFDAVRLIMANIANCAEHIDDPLYRTPIALGSMLSGMAFAQTGLGAVHALAHPIGAKYHHPHGLVCAALLVPVMHWNADAAAADYAELARACGLGGTADDFFRGVEGLLTRLNIPRIHQLGLQEKDIPFIVEQSHSNSMKTNPQRFSDEAVAAFLKQCLIQHG